MAINTPFVFNGWKYATDGRICVRIPTTEPDYSNEPFKRPDASALFKGFSVEGLEPFEIPTLDGVIKTVCQFCHGVGKQICDMGHEHDCVECDDDGTWEEWPKQEIGERLFSERYLFKMTALPGLKFYPTAANWDKLHPALFTFDGGGQGLLMPIRKEGGAMSAHTHGPWEVAEAGSWDGKRTSTEYFVRRPGDDVAITSEIIDPANDAPSEANARLIAAAPELLEALEEIDTYLDSAPTVRTIARAAIKKAKGETP